MNKTELASAIADKTGLSKTEASEALNSVLEAITDALMQGVQVQLSPFGTFTVRPRAGRVGRNPNTGEEIQIPAKNVAGFKPGKALKDAIQEATLEEGAA